MPDRICWQEGDEYRCKRCSEWHRTFVAHPDEAPYALNTVLHFTCPQSPEGYFYAGRIGEPVYEVDRWRRAALRESVAKRGFQG